MKAFKRNDWLTIFHYTGFIITITAILFTLPILVALFNQEWSALLDFLIGFSTTLIIGSTLRFVGLQRETQKRLEWKHGLVISSLSWLILLILCAIPYYLSQQYGSYLDAMFDVMSGFTTTGLTLALDLDHMSISLNVWRHMLTFVGGQGMVVLALSFLFQQTQGAYKIYVGEGKDVELVPNVKGTARIIWVISLINLFIGTTFLTIIGILQVGLQPLNAVLHGFCIFASSWSTGGFAPSSMNMLFYHSFPYELATMLFFLLGALNFGLHFAVIKRNKRELYRNIEVQSTVITVFISAVLLLYALSKIGLYDNAVLNFRKGIYHLLSAHTTTGFGTIYVRQFISDFGELGILILIIVMLIGGSACSTAGGIKGLRIGIIFKSILHEIKKSLSSERRILLARYHHIRDNTLDDGILKSSFVIALLYILLFTATTFIGIRYGYPAIEAAFEAASVTGNVGLSIGVTVPTMPSGLKITYIFAMFLGRMEFMSVFALIGILISEVKYLCLKKYSPSH